MIGDQHSESIQRTCRRAPTFLGRALCRTSPSWGAGNKLRATCSDVLLVMISSSKTIIEIDLEKDQESPARLISQFRTLLRSAKSFEVWFGKNFCMMSRRAEPL